MLELKWIINIAHVVQLFLFNMFETNISNLCIIGASLPTMHLKALENIV